MAMRLILESLDQALIHSDVDETQDAPGLLCETCLGSGLINGETEVCKTCDGTGMAVGKQTEKQKKDRTEKKLDAGGVIVCACGRSRCALIGALGLPKEVWEDRIAPIGSQAERDKRALEIKAERGEN